MSHSLINRNADLKALHDDGYEVSVESGYLLIHNVPHETASREVRRGTLVSHLDLAGDQTVPPKSHIALFAGEHPCDMDGNKLQHLEHQTRPERVADAITAQHSFSSKPLGGYGDYYVKMTTYVDMISRHARKLDSAATARTGNLILTNKSDSVFKYADTASSRAGINEMAFKLRGLRVDIIGMGGTGAYIFDHVCKTHVQYIHIYDADELLQHNAFRAPGAVPPRILGKRMKKVEYYAKHYGQIRHHISPHPVRVDASNVEMLDGTDFVFICVDNGAAKKPIIEWLEANGVPFIDVGMGVEMVDNRLRGLLRVTLSTADKRDHVRDKNRIAFGDARVDDVYSKNIQISELNALNAVFAVIKWKKLFGFYCDTDHEHNSLYMIDGNELINEDEDDDS